MWQMSSTVYTCWELPVKVLVRAPLCVMFFVRKDIFVLTVCCVWFVHSVWHQKVDISGGGGGWRGRRRRGGYKAEGWGRVQGCRLVREYAPATLCGCRIVYRDCSLVAHMWGLPISGFTPFKNEVLYLSCRHPDSPVTKWSVVFGLPISGFTPFKKEVLYLSCRYPDSHHLKMKCCIWTAGIRIHHLNMKCCIWAADIRIHHLKKKCCIWAADIRIHQLQKEVLYLSCRHPDSPVTKRSVVL